VTPHVIWTQRAIARRLGVAEEETVLGYAMLKRDPLRLHFLFGKYWIKTEKLDAWNARRQPGNTCPRIIGLDAIAVRFPGGGVSINTLKAYARREHDPIPIDGLGQRRPSIYESAFTDWIDAQDKLVAPAWLTDRRAG
jgi:hypothetical protein